MANSDGSMVVVSSDVHQEDGFTSEKVENGKDNFKCVHCPHSVKSGTKAAIKRHITTKHVGKAPVSPLPKSGTKRIASEDGDDEESDEKRLKMVEVDGNVNESFEDGVETAPKSTKVMTENDGSKVLLTHQ